LLNVQINALQNECALKPRVDVLVDVLKFDHNKLVVPALFHFSDLLYAEIVPS
jgi:hypothetical protein